MSLSGKTILQVIPELSTGGAERTAIEVAEAIQGAGGTALVASEGGRLVPVLEKTGAKHLQLDKLSSKNPLDIFKNARLLQDIIREHQVDLIHARSRAPAWSALWAARREKLPYVTTYHGIYKAKGTLKKLYNSVMARGETVIANSNFTADFIRKQHPEFSDRIEVIPRGVDIDKFTEQAVTNERKEALKRAWMISPDDKRIRIVLPARLTKWKGQGEAVLAARILSERDVPPWQMVFVGDAQGRDHYRLKLQEQINVFNLGDQISIVGHCDDMPAAFALADFVIAPSNAPEAFGRVAAEAGALGKAVIGSDLGGQKEVIKNGETGLLTQPGHITELADAMTDLLQGGHERCSTLGKAALDRVRGNFTTATLQASTVGVYERLLAKTP